MENVNCTVPRLRPKSTSAFTTTTLIACFAAVFLLLATPALASPTAHSYKRALSAAGYDDHDVGLHGFEFIRQHSQSLHANGIPSFNTTADVDENESGLEKRISYAGYIGLGLFLRGVAWAVSEIFSGAICRWLGSAGALNTGGEVACWIAPPLLVLLSTYALPVAYTSFVGSYSADAVTEAFAGATSTVLTASRKRSIFNATSIAIAATSHFDLSLPPDSGLRVAETGEPWTIMHHARAHLVPTHIYHESNPSLITMLWLETSGNLTRTHTHMPIAKPSKDSEQKPTGLNKRDFCAYDETEDLRPISTEVSYEICEDSDSHIGGAPDAMYYGFDWYGNAEDYRLTVDALDGRLADAERAANMIGEDMKQYNAWDECLCLKRYDKWISTGSLQYTWNNGAYNGYSECWNANCNGA